MAKYSYSSLFANSLTFIIIITSVLLRCTVASGTADEDVEPPALNGSSTLIPVTGTNCCMRIRKDQYLGLDANGDHLTVDVGECVDICRGWVSGFAGLKRCGGECYAKRTTMETYKLLTGEKEISVIRTCRCGDSGRCRRLRKKVIYYPDTEFEVHVDQGQCSSQGGCGSGTVCKATNFELKAIHSPTGLRNVPVVNECNCVGGCHRLPHFKDVRLEGGAGRSREGGEEGGSGEVTGQEEEEGGDVERLVQTVVDVGKCEGVCPTPPARCVPSIDNPEQCRLLLTPSTPLCLPVATGTIEMPFDGNYTQAFQTITQCGCGR